MLFFSTHLAMKKSILVFLQLLIFQMAFASTDTLTNQQVAAHFTWAMQHLHQPNSLTVLVTAHRGDWRNAPENSLQGLHNCIRMGVDIMEIDLKMTKDSQFVIMHDGTIDRTTNGKGKPADYTLAELKQFRLKNGLGRPSEHQIPTFREFMLAAKGKMIVGVDKGYAWLPQVVALLTETGTLQQAIVDLDDNTTLDEAEQRFGSIPADVMLMPIIAFADSNKAVEVTNSYLRRKNTVFQPTWGNDSLITNQNFAAFKQKNYGMWLNSLWPSLNGGHDDDRAVERYQPEETWGWLLKRGATILQTDRPLELLLWLRKNKLHM
jgi:glycerophosphoryl diester phosphodiesterase